MIFKTVINICLACLVETLRIIRGVGSPAIGEDHEEEKHITRRRPPPPPEPKRRSRVQIRIVKLAKCKAGEIRAIGNTNRGALVLTKAGPNNTNGRFVIRGKELLQRELSRRFRHKSYPGCLPKAASSSRRLSLPFFAFNNRLEPVREETEEDLLTLSD